MGSGTLESPVACDLPILLSFWAVLVLSLESDVAVEPALTRVHASVWLKGGAKEL